MKPLRILLFLTLFSNLVFSQKQIVPLHESSENKPILKLRNEITLGGFGEVVLAKKFMHEGERLLTVTNVGIKYWNTRTAELIYSRPHEIAELLKFDTVVAVSPDGSKLVAADGFNMSLKKLLGKKPKLPAFVYSLETGKQIAVLQRPENSIRRAVWTPDGKTLISFSASLGEAYNMEVCFWDGETLELRGSINVNKWNYLTRRGDKFIATIGKSKNTLGIKYEKPHGIVVWNTQTAKIEKTYTLDPEKSLKNFQITSDEKFLFAENDKRIVFLNLETGAQQNFSARDGSSIDSARLSPDKRFLAAENNGKILVWEIGAGSLPKFEILPHKSEKKEKFTTDFAAFNFDGKHIAVSQWKYKTSFLLVKFPSHEKTEIYDLETGKLNPAINFVVDANNAAISADRKFAVTSGCAGANFYSLEDMRLLYEFPLDCKQGTSSTYNFSTMETTEETYYYNNDIIVFHPQKNVSLVVKDNALEIYGAQKRLQILDAPRSLSKKYTRGSYGNAPGDLIANVFNAIEGVNDSLSDSSVGFLHDGETVYAVSADGRSIFFFAVDKNLLE
jgi:WD40 repeat protein